MPAYSSSSLDSLLHEGGSSRGSSAQTSRYSLEIAPVRSQPVVVSRPFSVRPVVVEPREVKPTTAEPGANRAK